MSIDPTLIDLAGRIERGNKRIERLEALEYETVAFATGGGPALICDIVLAAPTATVTLCPFAIPGGAFHLWLVISVGSDREVPPKMRMQVNGDISSSYSYYVREELPVFAPPVGGSDTEAIQAGGYGFFDSSWQICHPSSSVFSDGQKPRNACMMVFTDYTEAVLRQYQTWFAWSQREATPIVDFVEVEQGGGRYIGGGAITSIRVFHPPPGVFVVGSQFSLYAL